MTTSKKKLLFLHLPKCGGTALKSEIAKHYPSQSIFGISPIFTKTACDLFKLRLHPFRKHILIYAMATEKIQFVYGHFLFFEDVYNIFKKEYDYITILRHPVERFISNFFFNKYKKGSHFRINDSLDKFLETKDALFHGHIYVRYMAGQYFESYKNKDAINMAKANLKKFKLIGFLDNKAEFLKKFKQIFGFDLTYPIKNTNPYKNYEKEKIIEDKQLEKIRELCGPSLDIYNYAKEILGK
jgi:hypothetical protein